MKLKCCGMGCVVLAVLILAHGVTLAQTWTVPRTSYGQPDLQGVWDFATITPLERPEVFMGKETMTAEESASYERERFDLVNHDTDEGATLVCAGTGNYNEFWYDRGFGDEVRDRRTSLIIDPPSGRIPTLTTAAEYRVGFRERRSFESWESRGIAERCIAGFNTGPPMMPSAYNNYVQLIQTPDYVVVFNEMIHDARIVPLDSRPHLSKRVPQWLGSSRGQWDGDTLVIKTENFNGHTAFSENQGATENMTVVERFTRLDVDVLRYEFTVEDSATWARPWTAMITMTKSETPIYEYACHEGNYGMTNILSGARVQEGIGR
jgi:hypothetical protein